MPLSGVLFASLKFCWSSFMATASNLFIILRDILVVVTSDAMNSNRVQNKSAYLRKCLACVVVTDQKYRTPSRLGWCSTNEFLSTKFKLDFHETLAQILYT